MPVNDALRQKLREIVRHNIAQVKTSPYRAAYALDDEASWGHFVHPTMWRITDDEAAYPAWLAEVYGAGKAPARDRWITYEDIRPHLATWSVREFDAGETPEHGLHQRRVPGRFVAEVLHHGAVVELARFDRGEERDACVVDRCEVVIEECADLVRCLEQVTPPLVSHS